MRISYSTFKKRAKAIGVIMALAMGVSQPSAFAQTRIPFAGKNIFANGANVAWVSFASDLGPRSASSPNDVNFSEFQTIFKTMHANGANVMRLWLFTNGYNTPSFNSSGYVDGPGPYAIQDLKRILNLAQENNVGLILCLWSFDMLSQSEVSQTQLNDNYELLTDTSYTNAFIRSALMPMVDSVKGNPAIVAWEIFNEIGGVALPSILWGGFDHITMTDVQRDVNLMAGAIHRTDPNALVTTGALGFLSVTDVTPLLSTRSTWLKKLDSISPNEIERITNDFNATHRTNFTVQQMQEFMDKVAASTNYNYYKDDRLIAAGGDSLGTLDFYSVHYYTWEGAAYAPFLVPFSTWGLTKPLVIGEFMFSNILASGLFGGLLWSLVYPDIYSNGYAGALEWAYSNYAGSPTESMETIQSLRSMYESYPDEIKVNIVNRALDARVTASSNDTLADPSSSPGNITDGSLSTSWQADSSASQWVRIDLGRPDSISRVVIYWAHEDYAKQFSVQLSNNGTGWSVIKNVTGSSGGTNYVQALDGLQGAGRYVELTLQSPAKGSYSISEVQVYGDTSTVEAVLQSPHLPKAYSLSQNYPNPFNPTTVIRFVVPSSPKGQAGFVSLIVYDVLGRKVATLVDGPESAGQHTVVFNGSNLASGVYIYRIRAGNFTATRKMLLLK